MLKSIFNVAVATSLLLIASLGFAQSSRGIITGTVTDTTGAVVVGAAVAVERVEGGDKHTVTTGENGDYRVEALTPGSYNIKVTAPNFSGSELNNVMVSASVITPGNVRLEVGKASDVITVEASGERIKTESGELSAVIPSVQIKDLPILTGNPYELAKTLPGVSEPDERGGGFANGAEFSVDGLRPRSNNFLIDGFDNNDYGIAGQALQPTNQEAVAEVTILKNGYSAEYGRGGGSLSNLTFKSGTNTIHGAGWWQYSGSSLNAVKPEEAASGLTTPPHLVNNLYGFRVGGPLIKDKLFLFGSSQWLRSFGAQPAATLLLPTDAGVATLQSIGPNANVQLLLDSLGSTRGSTADPAQVSGIDAGDRPGCTPCLVEIGPLTRTDSAASLSREWTVRADYAPTTSDSVYVRYTDTHSSLTPDLFANSTALPSADTEQAGPARNVGVMWAHTFGPTAINELRFSGQQIQFGFDPTAATLANPIAHAPGLSLASSFGNTVWGGFSQATFPQGRSHKTFQIQDAVSISRGSHTFKLGADVAVILVRDNIPFNSDGTIGFNPGGACTSAGVDSECTDLANYVDNFSGAGGIISKQFGNPNISVPTNQQAFYFQDTWKVRPNFTLDYGIRYEYQPPDASNVLVFPSVNRSTALADPFRTTHEVEPDRNNWGPRLGFSYSPKFWSGLFGEDKTVIRGGAGIFFDSFFTNISDNTAASSPNTQGGTIRADSDPAFRGTPDAIAAVSAITPASSPFNTVTSVVSNLRNPMTYQWNINVQRQLPGRIVGEVAYVGTRGERLFVNEQLNPVDPATGNRLNPDRGSIVVRGNRGDSIYHGLQTQVTRTSGRLSLRAAYTFSRAIDNGSEVFATSGGASRWQDVTDPRSDRGPSVFDRKHRATVTWVYEFPSPHIPVLGAILGGWSATGALAFQSGAPETIYIGGFDQNGDGEAFNDRPSLGNPNAALNFSDACLNDPTCITGFGEDTDGTGNAIFDFWTGAPGTVSQFRYLFNDVGRNGNITRNTLYLPGQQTWDLGVIKRFKIPVHESEFELRADFFDAFNHPNEGVNNVIGIGDLGSPGTFDNVVGTKGNARQIQVWLKYSF